MSAARLASVVGSALVVLSVVVVVVAGVVAGLKLAAPPAAAVVVEVVVGVGVVVAAVVSVVVMVVSRVPQATCPSGVQSVKLSGVRSAFSAAQAIRSSLMWSIRMKWPCPDWWR